MPPEKAAEPSRGKKKTLSQLKSSSGGKAKKLKILTKGDGGKKGNSTPSDV